MTPEDRIQHALLELLKVIRQRVRNKQGTNEQFRALQKLEEIFKPGNKLQIDQTDNVSPPRVQTGGSKAPRVENDNEATQSPAESIADRVTSRHRAQATANPVLDYETSKMLEYRQLLKHPRYSEAWNRSAANEFGRLAQGVGGRMKGTNTIFFIRKEEVPLDRRRDVTYIKFVCNVRTEKAEPNRTRATMGGNLVHYPDDVGTPTASLLLVKILLNSVISSPGSKFATADIENFYLNTPLKRPEFSKVRLSDIPE